jgi:hypothetical protein
VERAAWKSSKLVNKTFLGNHKAENYVEEVSDLSKIYKSIGCNMTLQINFLDSHLELLA